MLEEIKQETKQETKTENKSEAWRDVEEVKKIIEQRDRWKTEFQSVSEKQQALEQRLAEFEKTKKESEEKTQLSELEGKRKYQEALELQKGNWTKEMQDYRQKVNSRLIPTSIRAALSSIEDLATDAAQDIPNLLQGKIGLSEDLEPVVLGEDGKPLIDKETLKPVSVDAYVKEFVNKRPYLRISTQSTSTNLKNGNKGGGGWDIQRATVDTAYAAEWIAADKPGYEAATKAYFSGANMKEMARKKWQGK